MGHTDATHDARGLPQLLKLGPGDVAALERVMGCTLDEARALFEAEDPRAVERAQFRTISEPPSQLRSTSAPRGPA